MKHKGRKFYGVVRDDRETDVIGGRGKIEDAKRALDADWPILLELTVTKVFVRERDLKEVETDEPIK